MKFFAIAMAAFMFATAAYAAPFSDVPRTHWAYDAIQKAVNAGILQGYDGKFEGQRLLNRYQMAVVVAKLLDGMKSAPAGRMGAPEDVKKMIANLEALTIEFADELALLNVKVSTLEDSFQELKQQVEAGTGHRAMAPAAGGLGFTAFASFGLIGTDKNDKVNTAVPAEGLPILTRDFGANDSNFFELPQVSLGVDKEVNPGVFFHAQFDFDATINGTMDDTVAVNEAYFFVDEIFGDIGGKVGAFALPFSMEHNGPFRTCNYTITPSMVNTFIEQYRPYGLELQKTKDVKAEDISWKFGIVSGTDSVGVELPLLVAAGSTYFPMLHDSPAHVNSGEGDDGFGFYVMIGKKPTEKQAFGWNVSYFDNGGDTSATAPADKSVETDFFNVGLEWSNDDFMVIAQYLDGTTDNFVVPAVSTDFTMFFLLVNFKIDEKQGVSLRYDDGSFDENGVTMFEPTAITFAYNRKVTENSMLQFEYLTVDGGDAGGEDLDQDDDIYQLRYKVHF